MKFRKQLLLHIIPEWSDQYLEYKTLKKLIKKYTKNIKKSGITQPMVALLNIAKKSTMKTASIHGWDQASSRPGSIDQRRSSHESRERREATEEFSDTGPHRYEEIKSDREEEHKELLNSLQPLKLGAKGQSVVEKKFSTIEEDLNFWVEAYHANIQKINTFYLRTLEALQERFEFMTERLARLKSDIDDDDEIISRQYSRTSENQAFSSQGEKSSEYQNSLSTDKEIRLTRVLKRVPSHGAQKDDLEYATSWTRAFYDVYEKTLWLKSYCRINKLAAIKQVQHQLRILKKFKKYIFHKENNELSEFLYDRTMEQVFVQHVQLSMLRHQLIECYAFQFYKGNKTKAKADLERNPVVSLRKKDSIPIAFFLGLSLGVLALMLLILFTPLKAT